MMNGWISFSSHMAISISIVAITTTLWLYWIIKSLLVTNDLHHRVIKGNDNHHRMHNTYASYICLLCQIWFIAAAGFEIFDFPPFYGLLDAHSIWHAATVPLGYMWYYFWEMDGKSIEDHDDGDRSDK